MLSEQQFVGNGQVILKKFRELMYIGTVRKVRRSDFEPSLATELRNHRHIVKLFPVLARLP